MLLNCGIGENSWESLGLQGEPPINPKGNQSWIFVGRTIAEAETPTLWAPDEKNWLLGKDPDAGKDWGQEEKGMTEDEMVGWHHWCDGHEFELAPGVVDGQGSLVCSSPWRCKKLDTTVSELTDWTGYCAYSTRTGTCGYNSDHRDTKSWISLCYRHRIWFGKTLVFSSPSNHQQYFFCLSNSKSLSTVTPPARYSPGSLHPSCYSICRMALFHCCEPFSKEKDLICSPL